MVESVLFCLMIFGESVAWLVFSCERVRSALGRKSCTALSFALVASSCASLAVGLILSGYANQLECLLPVAVILAAMGAFIAYAQRRRLDSLWLCAIGSMLFLIIYSGCLCAARDAQLEITRTSASAGNGLYLGLSASVVIILFRNAGFRWNKGVKVAVLFALELICSGILLVPHIAASAGMSHLSRSIELEWWLYRLLAEPVSIVCFIAVASFCATEMSRNRKGAAFVIVSVASLVLVLIDLFVEGSLPLLLLVICCYGVILDSRRTDGRYLKTSAVVCVVVCGALVFIDPAILERLSSWLNPEDVYEGSWEFWSGLAQILDGGIFGLGMESLSELPYKDIYSFLSMTARAYGVVGLLSIVILYFVFLKSILAIRLKDSQSIQGKAFLGGISAIFIFMATVPMFEFIGFLPQMSVPLLFGEWYPWTATEVVMLGAAATVASKRYGGSKT